MYKLPLAIYILLLHFWNAPLCAQGVPPELAAAFQQTLQNQRNTLGVKSLSAAVQFNNDSIWNGAYGISSTFPLDSVTPDYAYAIGSITKSITAACILQLADEGLLHLDDSVSKWLPPFPYVNPNITIRQLLRHQSGLYDVITNPAYDAATKVNLDSIWTLSNLVQDYINPPLFQPGTSWSYSNTNYALLGLIIEAVTGESYRTEFTNRFFGPLQLPSLLLPPFDPNPADIAHLWVYNPANNTSADAHGFYSQWHSFRSSAGPIGGYYGTARDIAVWNRAFLRGDLHSVDIMNEAKTTVATTMPNSGRYGLGIMERKFWGLTGYGHGGDIGYSGITYYFPAKDISITVLNNDAKKNSWALAPVIQALLKNYLDYEASVSTASPWAFTELNPQVYPNPFTDEVSVSLYLPNGVQDAGYQITDALGKSISNGTLGSFASGDQTFIIPTGTTWPSGVYFLSLQLDGTGTRAVRLVKM
ncbi:MAG: serine hydrolase [Chitinophagales bacterium]|nr:serine hydrolase [Chitinophagales bacterium]